MELRTRQDKLRVIDGAKVVAMNSKFSRASRKLVPVKGASPASTSRKRKRSQELEEQIQEAGDFEEDEEEDTFVYVSGCEDDESVL